MKCCYSCVYWDKAGKKVPIDVKKVVDGSREVEVRFGEKSVKMRGWRWRLEKPMRLREIRSLRLCVYGRGVISPWDECSNYLPKFSHGVLACQLGNSKCPYQSECRKHRRTSYIA